MPDSSGRGRRGTIDAVLFDLDGTLADTLPDLAAAMNAALSEHGSHPLPPRCYRGTVTGGSMAMIRTALGPDADPERVQQIRRTFLARYAEGIAAHTCLFPGVPDLLDDIEARGLAWGIVTNKPHALTRRLLDALGMAGRASCVVCGDTLRHAKPHPRTDLPRLQDSRGDARTQPVRRRLARRRCSGPGGRSPDSGRSLRVPAGGRGCEALGSARVSRASLGPGRLARRRPGENSVPAATHGLVMRLRPAESRHPQATPRPAIPRVRGLVRGFPRTPHGSGGAQSVAHPRDGSRFRSGSREDPRDRIR